MTDGPLERPGVDDTGPVSDKYADALVEILNARDDRYAWTVKRTSEPRGKTVTETPTD